MKSEEEMIPKYVPIVKAKQGELTSCENMNMHTRRQLLPLFELPKFTDKTNELVKYRDKPNPIECYLNDLANSIANVRGNLPIMLDIFHWAPNAVIEVGEHVLNYVTNRLVERKTKIIPVIGYERWEDFEYANALANINVSHGEYAIRLESYAFEDMVEEEHFLENIDEIISTLNLDTTKCSIILDFGDVTKTSIIDMQEKITEALRLLFKYKFKFVSIAGCSITPMINDMVPAVDSTAIVLRREMIAWQACKKLTSAKNLIFGDYGIASPNAAEGIIAPDANGKIRYTIRNNYFVVRGHSRRQGNKGEQMYDLSQVVIDSEYYMGTEFSWGDRRITDCANKKFKGRLLDWIAIDTNHHTHAVLSEIFEFETSTQKRVRQKQIA